MTVTKIQTAEIWLNGKRLAEFATLNIHNNRKTGACRVTGTLKPRVQTIAEQEPIAHVPGSTREIIYGKRKNAPPKSRPLSVGALKGGSR